MTYVYDDVTVFERKKAKPSSATCISPGFVRTYEKKKDTRKKTARTHGRKKQGHTKEKKENEK